MLAVYGNLIVLAVTGGLFFATVTLGKRIRRDEEPAPLPQTD